MNKLLEVIWVNFARISPVTASKISYYKTKHRFPNLKKPNLFDEKLSYLKLFKYSKDSLVAQCADKYEVREYVKNKGCGDSLNELYGVWSDPNEIPFEELPEKFVLKCTHGCHMNIICTDKKKIDKKGVISDLTKWMKMQQWLIQQELHYKAISPRIICEKYLEPEWGGG